MTAERRWRLRRIAIKMATSGLALVAVTVGLLRMILDGNDRRIHLPGMTIIPHHTGVISIVFPDADVWEINRTLVVLICALYFLWWITWLMGMPIAKRPAVLHKPTDEIRRGFAVIAPDSDDTK